MKDFFYRQDEAKKKTAKLIILFAASILFTVFFVYIAITAVHQFAYYLKHYKNMSDAPVFWSAIRFITVFIITNGIIIGGAVYKIKDLKSGGRKVAEMLGGRRIVHGSTDLMEKKLINVVEEMAIASGIPVPDIYIMDDEGGINAFAAGFNTQDAVICVTKGSISLLSRDELQGVIAHEFSHIFNGDTLINIRLIGLLHGILSISSLGEYMLSRIGKGSGYHSYRGSQGGLAFYALGIALFIIGYIGFFLSKLIKSAVSREREYLADASAVQFTRNPEGLGGALKKIAGLRQGSRIYSRQASLASHMYFSDGLDGSFFALMATHPPIEERIQRIDPYFNGVLPDIKPVQIPRPEPVKKAEPSITVRKDAIKEVTGAAAIAIISTMGAPMKEHADKVKDMLSGLPEPVKDAARDPLSACALIYLLLSDGQKEMSEKQLQALKASESEGLLNEVKRLSEYSSSITPGTRLPLVELALPALRNLSPEQYLVFKDNVSLLTAADQNISIFEFMLKHLIFRHLAAYFTMTKTMAAQIYSVRGVSLECSIVLSILARVGHDNTQKAEAAFGKGIQALIQPDVKLSFLSDEVCTFTSLDNALNKLDTASPLIKKKLLVACIECMTFDKTIKVEEAELFRAVADALGCPVPPWLLFQK